MLNYVDTEMSAYSARDPQLLGFIAGNGNGIVTVDGKPSQKRIIVFERIHAFPCMRQTWSNADGSYLIPWLDVSKIYTVMAVDDKEKYEPDVWDYIKPAIDNA